MIIQRHGEAPNFVYKQPNGAEIKDSKILEYVRGLVIPPKYKNVQIYVSQRAGVPCAPPKLTYTGEDEAGRIQYGYSAQWKTKVSKAKFAALTKFGQILPMVRKEIHNILSRAEPGQQFNIALIMRIVDLCHFRIGNFKYRDLYNSYGVSTLEARHLKFSNSADASVRIKFIGKKGVDNECRITDPEIVGHLKKLSAGKKPRQLLFTHNDCGVKATDINDWLRQFGADITSKMFRTYATNVILIELLRAAPNPNDMTAAARKRQLNSVLDQTSGLVHNTRAVCKKEYAHPDLIEMYLDHPRRYNKLFMGDLEPAAAFLTYLRR